MPTPQPESSELDETLWGPAPSEEGVQAAQEEMVRRATRWAINPPKRPEHYQPHPDSSHFTEPT